MKMSRRAPMFGAAILGLLVTLTGPAAAQVDETPIDRARMTQFARAHIAINAARDEFHGKVGRIHDEQGRDRAREEMEAQVAAVLEAQEMTREEYDHITLTISLDGAARALFEEILAEIATEGADPPG